MRFLAADVGPGCGRVLVPQNRPLTSRLTSASSNERSEQGFREIIDALQIILRDEGAMTFMKGWTASYLSIGPHTVISFILIEKVRQLFGMQTY